MLNSHFLSNVLFPFVTENAITGIDEEINIARYSVNNYTVDVLLADIKSGNIAIPEMQRPFVWDATQVRDLMDSLYKGFPVGYIIVWQNPSVKLKDGTVAIGKKF